MKTTHKINIDLMTPGLRPRVYAVQDDVCTREVQISLYSCGAAWSPARASSAAVGYMKPDGTVGLYDTLPNGSSAVEISGNMVTVMLAAQMLTCAGAVEAAVTLTDADGSQISTFAFDVIVSINPGSGAVKSEDYFNYVSPRIQTVIEQAAAAAASANAAADRANAASDIANEALKVAQTAEQKSDVLRDVVHELHNSIQKTELGAVIVLTDSADAKPENLRLFGTSVLKGTPTVESPAEITSVGDGGVVNARLRGKNLMPPDISSTILNDLKYTQGEDGSIVIDGTPKATANIIFSPNIELPPGDYVFTGIPGGAYGGYYLTGYDGVDKNAPRFSVYSEDKVVTITSGNIYQMRVVVTTGVTVSNVAYCPMIRPVKIKDATYEPYQARDLVLTLPAGCYLASVPGSDIRDYVDPIKGTYVQRVGIIESYAGEEVGDVYASSTGELNAGAKVLYPLPGLGLNHILLENEVAAFELARTFYQYTTLWNDEVAQMELRYMADTKLYIDSKFDELAQALVSAS